MADLPREDLLQKLHDLAQRQGRTVDDVLADFLAPYEESPVEEDGEDVPPPGTAARLVYEMDKANFYSDFTDTVERSREILNTEYAEYLLKRMDTKLDKLAK